MRVQLDVAQNGVVSVTMGSKRHLNTAYEKDALDLVIINALIAEPSNASWTSQSSIVASSPQVSHSMVDTGSGGEVCDISRERPRSIVLNDVDLTLGVGYRWDRIAIRIDDSEILSVNLLP